MYRPPILTAAIFIFLAACSETDPQSNQAADSSGQVRPAGFRIHHIEEDVRPFYKTEIADINNDGLPDIVTTTIGQSEPAWYRNPDWKRHLITDQLEKTALIAALEDLNEDGIPEIFISAGFFPDIDKSLGRIYRLQIQGDPAEPWEHELFDTIFMAHRMSFADLDNDGTKELVVSPIMGQPSKPMKEYDDPTPLYYYPVDTWERRTVRDDLHGTVHGMKIVDWDGTGNQDILTAGFDGIWLHQAIGYNDEGEIDFKSRRLARGKTGEILADQGSSDATLGRLSDGTRFLASIEPFHGNQVVIYTRDYREDEDSKWMRQVVDESLEHGHIVLTADLNDDGADEVIAGGDNSDGIHVYYAADDSATNWQKTTLDDEIGGQTCSVADLNQNGRLDIVCASNRTRSLRWYENLGE